MLEILPIQTKIEQEAICARCGMPYEASCLAYHALVDGELAGACQFRMNDKGGFIRHWGLVKDRELSAQDRAEALFVMGRGTLNFIDLCGVLGIHEFNIANNVLTVEAVECGAEILGCGHKTSSFLRLP